MSYELLNVLEFSRYFPHKYSSQSVNKSVT